MNEVIKENNYPNTCPHCKEKINPKKIYEHKIREWASNETYELVFICNNIKCNRTFATLFDYNYINKCCIKLNSNILYINGGEEFSNEIKLISPDFSKIYNEALICDNNGLKQVAGMGYRKAFEFLIKDYLISNSDNNSNTIKLIKEHSSISYLINEYIKDNDDLKEMAKRCSWLGNDQTHYVIKHKDHDLDDLKNILGIVVYYITMKIKTNRYLNIAKK